MKIAITGGIGSGKSYVCRLLADRGITVYDCDAAAKRLMHTSEALQHSLRQLVGADVYDGTQLHVAVHCKSRGSKSGCREYRTAIAVSYTHLTLPTT
mgnify:CR=1 FL=1